MTLENQVSEIKYIDHDNFEENKNKVKIINNIDKFGIFEITNIININKSWEENELVKNKIWCWYKSTLHLENNFLYNKCLF